MKCPICNNEMLGSGMSDNPTIVNVTVQVVDDEAIRSVVHKELDKQFNMTSRRGFGTNVLSLG